MKKEVFENEYKRFCQIISDFIWSKCWSDGVITVVNSDDYWNVCNYSTSDGAFNFLGAILFSIMGNPNDCV